MIKNDFQARIKLGGRKNSPITFTGYNGRTVKKGESFITVDPKEYLYYSSQSGFSTSILKGKITSVRQQEEEQEEEDFENEEEEREEEVDGLYEKADLKKMSRSLLLSLIEEDKALDLSVEDVPKKASKKEIIELILSAQESDEEEDDDDE